MILMLILGAIVIGWACVYVQSNHNKLLREGKIIERNLSFVRTAEILITKINPEQVIEVARNLSVIEDGISWSIESEAIYFQYGKSWVAKLSIVDANDNSYKYLFHFTKWKTHNTIPQDANHMNILLTALEKAFLSLDASTQVETTMQTTTSHINFF